MSSAEWMPLNEAVKVLQEHLSLSSKEAKDLIDHLLVKGVIGLTADMVETSPSLHGGLAIKGPWSGLVEPAVLMAADIDCDANTFKLEYSISEVEAERIATGLRISAEDFFYIWPLSRSPTVTQPEAAPREDEPPPPSRPAPPPAHASAGSPAEPPPLRGRGREQSARPRVRAAMEKWDRKELEGLDQVAMAATFNASRETCVKARREVLSANVVK